MMPGETILSGAPQICGPVKNSPVPTNLIEDTWELHPTDESGRPVTVDVLWDVYQSGAGYYIGTFCPHCGPNTRESNYFRSKDQAELMYRAWLPFILDGKFDHEAYEAADYALPYERN